MHTLRNSNICMAMFDFISDRNLKIGHGERGNYRVTPTEVFNVKLRGLSDICRWLGWKGKVSGGEAFRVLLHNGVFKPCDTVAHVFHC